MRIEKLECKNFRNYEVAEIEFSPGTNILYGDNAQGKTNLLEAIHDTMVHCGTITDDNYKIVKSVDGSRVEYDKTNPRTEIWITKYAE